MRVAAGKSLLRTRDEAEAEKTPINKNECLNIVNVRLLCIIKECRFYRMARDRGKNERYSERQRIGKSASMYLLSHL